MRKKILRVASRTFTGPAPKDLRDAFVLYSHITFHSTTTITSKAPRNNLAMNLTFVTDIGDTFSLEIDSDMELETVLVLLEAEVSFILYDYIHY